MGKRNVAVSKYDKNGRPIVEKGFLAGIFGFDNNSSSMKHRYERGSSDVMGDVNSVSMDLENDSSLDDYRNNSIDDLVDEKIIKKKQVYSKFNDGIDNEVDEYFDEIDEELSHEREDCFVGIFRDKNDDKVDKNPSNIFNILFSGGFGGKNDDVEELEPLVIFMKYYVIGYIVFVLFFFLVLSSELGGNFIVFLILPPIVFFRFIFDSSIMKRKVKLKW